jgi:hypothetical protein
MMSEPSDDELRARFHDLGADDRAGAPPFRPLLERAEAEATRAPGSLRRAPVWVVAAAAATVVLAAGGLLRRSDDGSRSRLAETAAGARSATTISNWKSPTAGLLRAPITDLLAPPSVLSSTLDGVIRAPVHRKGDSR